VSPLNTVFKLLSFFYIYSLDAVNAATTTGRKVDSKSSDAACTGSLVAYNSGVVMSRIPGYATGLQNKNSLFFLLTPKKGSKSVSQSSLSHVGLSEGESRVRTLRTVQADRAFVEGTVDNIGNGKEGLQSLQMHISLCIPQVPHQIMMKEILPNNFEAPIREAPCGCR